MLQFLQSSSLSTQSTKLLGHFLLISPLRPTVDLIGAMETQSEPSELELDDVVITNPHIEAILENEEWIEDASYGLFTMSFSAIIMIIIHKNSISHLSTVFSSTHWLSVFLYPQWSSVSLHFHPEGNLSTSQKSDYSVVNLTQLSDFKMALCWLVLLNIDCIHTDLPYSDRETCCHDDGFWSKGKSPCQP